MASSNLDQETQDGRTTYSLELLDSRSPIENETSPESGPLILAIVENLYISDL